MTGMMIRRHVPRLESTVNGDHEKTLPVRAQSNHRPPSQPRRKAQASNHYHKSGKVKPSYLFPVHRLISRIILVLVFGRCMLHLHQISQRRRMSSPKLYPKFASSLRPVHDKSSHLSFRPERLYPGTVHMYDEASIVKVPRIEQEENPWLVADESDDEECVPMHKWMLPSHSPYTCNSLHELELGPSIKFINSGGSRSAFEIRDHFGYPMVLKKHKYDDDSETDDEQLEHAWKDTISMERLSSSPHVLDIYGNCGATQLTELATGGRLYDQIKIAHFDGETMSPMTKLKIGYQIASAVADLHSCDGDEAATITHNDLCCHQFLFVDGVYKLTDFHMASFTQFDREHNDTCMESPADVTSTNDKTRAPEELIYSAADSSDNERDKIHRDKADVWLMGDILYYVLTKQWMFEGITTENAKVKIMNGETPLIPSVYLQSTKEADKAMVKAIQMAWVFDPNERSTAREIATFLQRRLEELDAQGKDEDGIWRVSVPPLPADIDNYDSDDFDDNLGGSSSSDDSNLKELGWVLPIK